jgi:hypothetical protein
VKLALSPIQLVVQNGDMELLIVAGLFIVLNVAAALFGRDSRNLPPAGLR